MSIRVRFAPSPTGYLHVGGARTALFNWLLVRKEGGAFVLRIEDTDRERSSEEHTQAILHGMEWLGIGWDEGPYFQSEGLERHRADVQKLLEAGRAFRDFSTPEEVARDREEDREAGKPLRRARERSESLGTEEESRRIEAGEPFAVRFRVPEGETVWDDLVHGEMRFKNGDLDDLVVLRGDGSPIYNMAVVSDDAHMNITHVIRGDDHLSNTPKQILIYQALELPVPRFGHMPLILGPDGKRLSKRHGATAVGEYEGDGILPSAMFNFLSLLGWSPGDDQEVMTRQELVDRFSMERVLKKSAVFDLQKLEWLNGQHLAAIDSAELEPRVVGSLVAQGVATKEDLSDRRKWLLNLIDLLKVRSRRVDEIPTQAAIYFGEEVAYEEKAVDKIWAKDPDNAVTRLRALSALFEECAWEEEALESVVRGLAEREGVGAGKVIHPLRVAVTGTMASPGIFDVLMVLGRDVSLSRIAAAIAFMERDQ
jgi:glutamyl-tRNA synthetase